EAVKRRPPHRHGPDLIEGRRRIGLAGDDLLQLGPVFRESGNEAERAAAFLRLVLSPAVGEKVSQQGIEETAKAPALLADAIKPGALENVREELLRRILGIVFAQSLPPAEDIHWPPVGAAKPVQRRALVFVALRR